MSRNYVSVDESMKQGGPAFPGKVLNVSFAGMTLRDYFAAQAMQALIAADKEAYQSDVAKYAYSQADAMLEARK